MKRPVLLVLILGAAFVLVVGAGLAAWYFLANRGLDLAGQRQKYGADYEAKRQQLKKLAALLPPPGSVQGNVGTKDFDPPLLFDVPSRRFDVEIVMAAQLLDPDVDLIAKKEVDLLLSDAGLLRNIHVLGPKSERLPHLRLSGKDLDQYEEKLRIPYLIAIRPVTFVRPMALGKDAYTPGMADLEVFVIDLRTEKIRAAGRLQARSAASTTALLKKSDNEAERIEAAAYSTLWSDARQKLAVLLGEITGGTFVLER